MQTNSQQEREGETKQTDELESEVVVSYVIKTSFENYMYFIAYRTRQGRPASKCKTQQSWSSKSARIDRLIDPVLHSIISTTIGEKMIAAADFVVFGGKRGCSLCHCFILHFISCACNPRQQPKSICQTITCVICPICYGSTFV